MNEETRTTATAPAEEPAKQEQPTAATTETPKTYTQDDLDRIVAQKQSQWRRQHDREVENAREEARTEAEKLAKMTEEQRVQHEREKAEQETRQREADLAKREAELNRRELKTGAIDALESKGLPRGLADILDYSDADACSASIESVEKVFREAVQAEVDKRLRASGVRLPAPAGQPDYAKMSDAEYYAATYQKKS